jgi:glutathione synthase/RimK-type ligase-like ATP-grasp enzyme
MIYLIYCKNFCKCHNVPTPSTTIIKNKNNLKKKKREITEPGLVIHNHYPRTQETEAGGS